MPALLTAVNQLIDAIRGQKSWVEEPNDLSQKVGGPLRKAKRGKADEALRPLAGLFPNVPPVALVQVAISCGSLVEIGGDPGIAGPHVVDKVPRVNETVTEFYARCRVLTETDQALLSELRSEAKANAEDGEERNGELTPTDLVTEHVANHGWVELAQKFGPVLYEDHSLAVLGHMAEEFFRLALIAHLSRSKPLRAADRGRPKLLQQTVATDTAAGHPSSFLVTTLRVLVPVYQRKLYWT